MWQDHGGDYWFVSQGRLAANSTGLLPTRRMEPNDIGEHEAGQYARFGFGPCGRLRREYAGRRQTDRETTPYANGRATYQQGDAIEWRSCAPIRCSSAAGRPAMTSLTFGVRADPLLAHWLTTRSSPRRHRPTATAVCLHDHAGRDPVRGRRPLDVQRRGGSSRWRVNSGSWTTADIAATVALSGGITARFVAGATPSWADGDVPPAQDAGDLRRRPARTPSDESMAWTGSTLKSTSLRQAAAQRTR